MTKCLNFTIREQKLSVGPKKGQKVYIARPTDRQRVTHRKFCEEVARATTFTGAEVEAVLRLAAEMAKRHVESGESRRPHRRLQRHTRHKEANGETTSIYPILHTRRRNLRTSRTKSKETRRQQTRWRRHSTSPISKKA